MTDNELLLLVQDNNRTTIRITKRDKRSAKTTKEVMIMVKILDIIKRLEKFNL